MGTLGEQAATNLEAKAAKQAAAALKKAEKAAAKAAAKAARQQGTRPPQAPPAPPVPTTPAAATTTTAGSPSKYKGAGTMAAKGIPGGLRRMEFQDRLLAINDRPDMRLTDEQLAAIMDREHPGGVKIRPDHMRAIRRLYNEGKHTKNGRIPATPSVPYDADKKPLVAVAKSAAAAK